MQRIGRGASSNEHLLLLARPFFVGQAFPLAVAGRNACATIRPPASLRPVTSRSGSEAFAAGTMRDGIRVCNLKPAFLQVVAEIEDRPADEQCALGIDHDSNIG